MYGKGNTDQSTHGHSQKTNQSWKHNPIIEPESSLLQSSNIETQRNEHDAYHRHRDTYCNKVRRTCWSWRLCYIGNCHDWEDRTVDEAFLVLVTLRKRGEIWELWDHGAKCRESTLWLANGTRKEACKRSTTHDSCYLICQKRWMDATSEAVVLRGEGAPGQYPIGHLEDTEGILLKLDPVWKVFSMRIVKNCVNHLLRRRTTPEKITDSQLHRPYIRLVSLHKRRCGGPPKAIVLLRVSVKVIAEGGYGGWVIILVSISQINGPNTLCTSLMLQVQAYDKMAQFAFTDLVGQSSCVDLKYGLQCNNVPNWWSLLISYCTLRTWANVKELECAAFDFCGHCKLWCFSVRVHFGL